WSARPEPISAKPAPAIPRLLKNPRLEARLAAIRASQTRHMSCSLCCYVSNVHPLGWRRKTPCRNTPPRFPAAAQRAIGSRDARKDLVMAVLAFVFDAYGTLYDVQ